MKKIKLGNELKVGGFDYDMISSKEWDAQLQEGDCLGRHFIDNDGRHLIFHSSQPPQEFSHTAIHEIFESINCVYLDGTMKEVEINAMSAGWHQVLEQLGVRLVK